MELIQECLQYVITKFLKLLGIETVAQNEDFVAY